MALDKQLADHFLYLLDICRKPELSFGRNTQEYVLAKAWMDRLCTYTYENVNDRRLQNLYLSHLCAALIERKLQGPFLRLPPMQKLEHVDFTATGKPDAFSPPKGKCSDIKGSSCAAPNAKDSSKACACNSQTPPDCAGCCAANQNQCSMVSETACSNYSQMQSTGQTSMNQCSLDESSMNQSAMASQFQRCPSSTVNNSCGPPVPVPPCAGHGYENAPGICCDEPPPQRSQGGDEHVANSDSISSALREARDILGHELEDMDLASCSRSQGGAEFRAVEDDFISNFLAQELNFTPEFIQEFESTLSTFMHLCKLIFLDSKSKPLSPRRAIKRFKESLATIQRITKSDEMFGKPTIGTTKKGAATEKVAELQQDQKTPSLSTSDFLNHVNERHISESFFSMDEERELIRDAKTVPRTPYPSTMSFTVNAQRLGQPEWSAVDILLSLQKAAVRKARSGEEKKDAYKTAGKEDENAEELRRDIASLLQMISSELRGDTEPGCSDYLEHELSRYKAHLYNCRDLAKNLDKLKSDIKLRNFLLLNLQNDLIRLLSN